MPLPRGRAIPLRSGGMARVCIAFCIVATFAIAQAAFAGSNRRSVFVPLQRAPRSLEQSKLFWHSVKNNYYGDLVASKYITQGSGYSPFRNYGDLEYIGNITAGTPGQTVRMIFDTGSTNVWFCSAKCISGCSGKMIYNHSRSATYVPNGKEIEYSYGTGDMIGFLSSDNLNIGGITVANQTFAEAKAISNLYDPLPLDGVLGLGYAPLATPGVVPLVDTMIKQNLLDQPIFSVFLDSTPGSTASGLLFGATDPSLYVGDIFYVPVSEQKYWMVKTLGMFVNGKDFSGCNGTDIPHCKAIIDTGSSIISGPADAVQKIAAAIGPVKPDCSNRHLLPAITFKFNGVNLKLTAATYVVKDDWDGSGKWTCGLGIKGSSKIPFWILGDVLLRGYYTVFDKGQNRIGFANLKNPPTL